ncbi:MAG: ComEC/Rec2 family competence protein [Deinococcus sp.]|uniref:ComEC/Rec2 family competence protein n=1 Tax=Deinococcus sp. TaxID=47478 RepID=UPI0026DB7526|nr:ComEC/Rec2 family competence protein [Deinococcus sp.]MDO4244869.1 ComEC/Rec2 family competence protein [Deinococcus sp.]
MSRSDAKSAPRRTASKSSTAKSSTAGATRTTSKAKTTSASGSRSSTARAKTTTRASTSTRAKSGTTRARSAALAKSAPTVRMRVDERDLQPARQPGSADILAVALVVFMCVLAACNTQLDKGRGEPTGQVAPPQGEVSVQFLNVGQGDAVLVRSPEGKTMLVDGGRSAERMREQLAAQGVGKIDLMVASHADADHIAGLVEGAKSGRPTLFINNGIAGTTQTWDRLVTALQDAGTTFQKANGQVVNLGSVKVKVITPPSGMGDDQNDNSVGVRVEFGQFVALLTGDSEKKETEAWMAENRPEVRGPVQVYKSIHHGAANGDHQAWLDVVKPENVVISVGDNNYGHPTAAALNLYKANNLRIFRTDRQGTVTFRGKADGTYISDTER